MNETREKKDAQLSEVLAASNIEPGALAAVTKRLEDVLDVKNKTIRALQLEVAKVRKLFGSRGDSDHQHAQLLLGTRSSGLDVAERVMLKRQQSRAAESGEDDAGSAGTSSPQSPVVPDQVDARERAREKAREKAAARIAAISA